MHHSSHGCYKYSLRWKGVAISKGKSACLWIALKPNFKCRVFQDKNRTIARRDNTTMKIAAFLADTPQILKRAMMTWPAFMENGNRKEIQQSTPPFPAKRSSLRAIQRINRYLHWSIWMHFSHARQSVLEAMLVQMLFLSLFSRLGTNKLKTARSICNCIAERQTPRHIIHDYQC